MRASNRSIKYFRLLELFFVALMMTGCIAQRQEISVSAATDYVPSSGSKGSVYIVAVTDDRDFTKDSSDNAIPSLDQDVSKTSKEEIATIIGRQSGGLGTRWANITLPKGENVMKKMRELVENSLKRAGYQPSNDPSSLIKADVSVSEFWAWLRAGVAFDFGANVGATVKLTMPDGKKTTIAAKGHGENIGHIVKTENFKQALDPAIAEFLNKLASELDKIPSTKQSRQQDQSGDSAKYGGLKELYELRKSGAITEQEYDEAKKKILGKL